MEKTYDDDEVKSTFWNCWGVSTEDMDYIGHHYTVWQCGCIQCICANSSV